MQQAAKYTGPSGTFEQVNTIARALVKDMKVKRGLGQGAEQEAKVREA